jgi:hypothetical protein
MAIVNEEGVIHSFFKPNPLKHGLPTNEDYFQSEAW